MNDDGLPIDVEAAPHEDVRVSEEVARSDMAAIHGGGWNEEPGQEGFDETLLRSLDQWLGRDHVASMSPRELEALRRGVAKLPEPESEDSFVWGAIRSPEDVPHVAEAVVGYRRFDPNWLDVSDAMGANAHFRREIRSARLPRDMDLASLVQRGGDAAKAVEALRGHILALSAAMSGIFAAEQFTLGAGLAALGAMEALRSLPVVSAAECAMGRIPQDEELASLDGLRRRAVVASEAVRKACHVEPLRFSAGALSGVKRSVMDKRAGDFVFAVEALGGSLSDREALAEAGRAFLAYFAASEAFSAGVLALGFAPHEEGALVARLSIRRCLRSSAREAGLDWEEVSPQLAVRAGTTAAEFHDFLAEATLPSLSGRLMSVCKDRSRPLAEIAEAARKVSVEKRYWLAAGERVLAVRPKASLGDMREVIDAEPSVAKWRDALKEVGALTRADVDALERHLEWMVSAYALPVPDEALERIVETRAAIVPMRLAAV
ncbi:MAG: hypothetical protein EOR63_32220 [Mesorhizobium sp.]|nr:MAG: hypothetical protein EOR63_32220 [Mesorhizobium sp.]